MTTDDKGPWLVARKNTLGEFTITGKVHVAAKPAIEESESLAVENPNDEILLFKAITTFRIETKLKSKPINRGPGN